MPNNSKLRHLKLHADRLEVENEQLRAQLDDAQRAVDPTNKQAELNRLYALIPDDILTGKAGILAKLKFAFRPTRPPKLLK